MIRNAILHLPNEQPLLVDLFELPRSDDVSLVCTNLRQLNGQRPIFVERSESVFVFPYSQVRFLELPPGAATASGLEGEPGAASVLREIGLVEARPVGVSDGSGVDGEDVELDPAFLERIREI